MIKKKETYLTKKKLKMNSLIKKILKMIKIRNKKQQELKISLAQVKLKNKYKQRSKIPLQMQNLIRVIVVNKTMKELKMEILRQLKHLQMMNRLRIQNITLKLIVKVLIRHKEKVRKMNLFQKTTTMIKNQDKLKETTPTHNNQRKHSQILKRQWMI